MSSAAMGEAADDAASTFHSTFISTFIDQAHRVSGPREVEVAELPENT